MKVTDNKQLIALLVIDPYNDFISEGGKTWDRHNGVAEANNEVASTREVVAPAGPSRKLDTLA